MEGSKEISLIDQYVIDFVRKLRDEKKVSQEEIGNIIGVSRTYITNVESTKHPAKYNLSHINLLADYFDLSPRDFLPEKSL
ncbi:MAG TPA: helix-turn-helix transcriptional regulator [Daejeonella sp.]|uniref:helix-turn-helix domain-containing protein n=1 Tax=Daejeonella sp. TaxID=2805397 RepID=UPI002EDA5A3F